MYKDPLIDPKTKIQISGAMNNTLDCGDKIAARPEKNLTYRWYRHGEQMALHSSSHLSLLYAGKSTEEIVCVVKFTGRKYVIL